MFPSCRRALVSSWGQLDGLERCLPFHLQARGVPWCLLLLCLPFKSLFSKESPIFSLLLCKLQRRRLFASLPVLGI